MFLEIIPQLRPQEWQIVDQAKSGAGRVHADRTGIGNKCMEVKDIMVYEEYYARFIEAEVWSHRFGAMDPINSPLRETSLWAQLRDYLHLLQLEIHHSFIQSHTWPQAALVNYWAPSGHSCTMGTCPTGNLCSCSGFPTGLRLSQNCAETPPTKSLSFLLSLHRCLTCISVKNLSSWFCRSSPTLSFTGIPPYIFNPAYLGICSSKDMNGPK